MKKELAITKMWSKGGTVIPKEVREILDLRTTSRVVWVQENNRIYIRKAR